MPSGLEECLIEALRATGKNGKEIGDEAGVPYSIVYKFLQGTGEIRSGTFCKLASYLGLGLVPIGQAPKADEQSIDNDTRQELQDIERVAAEIVDRQNELHRRLSGVNRHLKRAV